MTKSPTKSDRTRAAILEAAAGLFAELGYERATVREIAERARIDPAMVIRYFGSKDDLFALAATFDLKLPDLRGLDRRTIGEALVRHFLDIWEDDGARGGLPILLRSAASNRFAADRLRQVFADQVIPALARGGIASARPVERAALVATQLLGLALCRYVLKLPPVVALPRDDLIREVGRTLQRYITGKD